MAQGVGSPGGALATLGIFALGLAGCSEAGAPSVAVSDSAGVQIVTNLPGSLDSAERWELSVDPTVSIGSGADPELALYRVTDLAPLTTGGVVVAMNAPARAVVLDQRGRLVSTLGRAGEGPGEFSSVASVVPIPGDSIAVWDPDRRRISVFTITGDLAREVDLSDLAPISTRAAPDSRSNSGITHLLTSAEGAFVVFGEGAVASDPEPGVNRAALPAVRISAAGTKLADFGEIPGMEWHFGGPAGALPLPFGARTYAATMDTSFIVGTAEEPEYRVFGPDGDLTRVVRWPDRDRTVGGAYLSRWSDMVDSAPPPIRQMVEAMPRREQYPAYEGILAGGDGEIWVGEYAGPLGIWPLRRADHGPAMLRPQIRTQSREWLVFGREGALLARVRTPAGFEPYSVTGDRLWGVYSDSLDVESVRAFGIARN